MIEASNSENVQDFTGMSGPGLAKALQMKKANFVCESKAQILRALKHGLASGSQNDFISTKKHGQPYFVHKIEYFLVQPDRFDGWN